MTTPTTTNDHTNFETWAFYTHVTQTERLLNEALTIARPLVEQDFHPAVVGDHVVRYFQEWCWDTIHAWVVYDDPQPWKDATLMAKDVGSWWRIDDASIGRHLTEYVKESA